MSDQLIIDPQKLSGQICLAENEVGKEKAYVRFCPELAPAAVKASACESCKFFAGFLKVAESGEFNQKYRIICCHPMTRQMIMVE